MKMKNLTTLGICASLLLGGTLAGTSIANAQGAGVGTGQAKPPKLGKGEKHEKHPALMMAMKRLEAAKDALQKADRDFGGHRTKAIELTNAAMAEVREAMKFDKN
jgi:Spy/CpxP family protein refolding chaperone